MTLEQHGIPTATVITHVFEAKAHREAAAFGIADLPLIVLPHPVGTLPAPRLHALADQVYPQIVQTLVNRG